MKMLLIILTLSSFFFKSFFSLEYGFSFDLGQKPYHATLITTDSKKFTYVAGYIEHSGHKDAFIMQIDQKGSIVWVKEFGSNRNDLLVGLKTDSNDNVYVLQATDEVFDEWSYFSWDHNKFLAKFNSRGDFIWEKKLESLDTETLLGVKMEIDLLNNVYLMGRDYMVKYDSDGRELWKKSYKKKNFQFFLKIDTKDKNSIYSFDLQSIDKKPDFIGFLIKFDSQGNEIFEKEIYSNRGGKNVHDSIKKYLKNCKTKTYDVATLDSDNNLYIGYHLTDCQNIEIYPLSTDSMKMLTKFNLYGKELWTIDYTMRSSNPANLLLADSKDNIFIGGKTLGDFKKKARWAKNIQHGFFDGFLIKLHSNSTILWEDKFGGQYDDHLTSIARDSNDNIYSVGYYSSPSKSNPATLKSFIIQFKDQTKSQEIKENSSSGFHNSTSLSIFIMILICYLL